MSHQLMMFEEKRDVVIDCEWVECPGFPLYEVSVDGRFRRRDSHKQMSQGKEINGYKIVLLCTNGKQYARLSHRLICEAFHGPPPFPKAMVDHIDRTRTNNHASNLQWVSRSENAKRFWKIKKSI